MGDLLNVDMNYLIGKKESTEIIPDSYYLNPEARDMAQFLFENPEYQGPLRCLTESEAGGHSVCKRDYRDRGAQKKWESL